jgi:transcriptional regulator with XRE-family HTH domain
LTQTQLVAASGVSLGTLARYERGEVDPQAGVLAALAAALGMTGRELLRPVKGW